MPDYCPFISCLASLCCGWLSRPGYDLKNAEFILMEESASYIAFFENAMAKHTSVNDMH